MASAIELVTGRIVIGIRSAATTAIELPSLTHTNARLRERSHRLALANADLRERLAQARERAALRPIMQRNPHAIEARVIGFPPENVSRSVTVDAGSRAGVRIEDGVLAADGAVGRIIAAGPISSTVLLLTDYTSRIPAIVRHGRWWGIARGNLSGIRLVYVTQDAPLRVGDVVVTGEGRSFHSGIPIGRITEIDRSPAALYQSAVVKPTVHFGALDRVVIIPR